MPLLPLLLQVATSTPSPPPEAAVTPPIVAEAATPSPSAADTCARGRVLESLSFPSPALGGEMRYSPGALRPRLKILTSCPLSRA